MGRRLRERRTSFLWFERFVSRDSRDDCCRCERTPQGHRQQNCPHADHSAAANVPDTNLTVTSQEKGLITTEYIGTDDFTMLPRSPVRYAGEDLGKRREAAKWAELEKLHGCAPQELPAGYVGGAAGGGRARGALGENQFSIDTAELRWVCFCT